MWDEGRHSQDSSDTIGTPGFYLIKDQWMEMLAFPFLHSPPTNSLAIYHEPPANAQQVVRFFNTHRMWKPKDITFKLKNIIWTPTELY